MTQIAIGAAGGSATSPLAGGVPAEQAAEVNAAARVKERQGGKSFELLQFEGNAAPSLAGLGGQQPLPIPGVLLAPDEVLLTTQALVDVVQSMQAKNVVDNLRQSSENIDKANKEKMKALLDRMDKTLKALEKQKAMKTLSDVTFGLSIAVTILSMIGAGLLAFATGGLATPLLVGTAIGAVNTLLDGVDRALQNDPKAKYGKGVLEGKQVTVSIAGLISTSHEAILKSIPEFTKMSKADQQLVIAVLQIVTSLVVAVMVSGMGAAVGVKAATGVAGKIAEKTAEMTSMAMKATANLVSRSASAASTVGEIVEIASNIAASFIGAFVAADRLQMNLADNKSQKFALIVEVQSRFKDVLQDVLEKVMADKESSAEAISTELRAYHDAQSHIARTS